MGDWSDNLEYEQREHYGHFYDPDREEETEEEETDDLISRQAVLDGIAEWIVSGYADSEADCSHISSLVTHLPSVENKGEWIYDKDIDNWRCSRCGQAPKTMGYVGTADFMATHFKFCNHCGARMKGCEE